MLSIEIHDSGNASFAEDPFEETLRLLRETVKKIEQGKHEGKIMDSNGNTVGSFYLGIGEE